MILLCVREDVQQPEREKRGKMGEGERWGGGEGNENNGRFKRCWQHVLKEITHASCSNVSVTSCLLFKGICFVNCESGRNH